MTSIEKSILAARDSLNEDNWHQGSYFAAKNGKVCMCAHGALQAYVNPSVAKALSVDCAAAAQATAAAAAEAAAEKAAGAAMTAGAARLVEAAAAAGAGALAAASAADEAVEKASDVNVWNSRPRWVKNGLDAHYVLGMVGLTAAFNDAQTTTIRSVKKKFTQAAKLARKLEKLECAK